jgi:transcriptional regulator with XRE-family HTH domain
MTARQRADTFGAVVGRRLHALREERGMTLGAVARHMGVHLSAVSQIERYGRDLRVDTVRRYCAAIGATIRIELEETP